MNPWSERRDWHSIDRRGRIIDGRHRAMEFEKGRQEESLPRGGQTISIPRDWGMQGELPKRIDAVERIAGAAIEAMERMASQHCAAVRRICISQAKEFRATCTECARQMPGMSAELKNVAKIVKAAVGDGSSERTDDNEEK